jgi:dTDP-4-dehydrorhamnose reductase
VRYQDTVFSNPVSKLSFALHPSSRSNLEASMAWRLAREQSEVRIVAVQVGAPTSARAIADGLGLILASAAAPKDLIRQKFDEADGLVHITASGETSWHGFASTIVDGLRKRGLQLAVSNIAAIETREFPTKAVRPLNSRLDMGRVERIFGIKMPTWRDALSARLRSER